MSESEKLPSQPGQPGRDSRFETFLREASAVITTEKGMTPAANSKIRAIADRLSLPQELYDTALNQLQSAEAPLGELTRYEQSFIKYLEKEFEKLQGGVLTISMEENAIGKAESRFEIPAHRADRLIDHQSKRSGVGRLARDDAKEYGRQMINERIGRALTIDGSTEHKFYKLGRQWGLNKEQTNKQFQIRCLPIVVA